MEKLAVVRAEFRAIVSHCYCNKVHDTGLCTPAKCYPNLVMLLYPNEKYLPFTKVRRKNHPMLAYGRSKV